MSSWFGGPASTTHKSHHSERRTSTGTGSGVYVRTSNKREPSPKRYFVRPHSPSAQSTRSFTSFFTGGGGGKHTSSSSYYKRRPRDGFVARMLSQIKRYLRDIIDYARRNPLKVVMLVLPLLTGGALATILKTVGIKVPAGLAGFMGAGREGASAAGLGGAMSGGGMEQALNIAKMFI